MENRDSLNFKWMYFYQDRNDLCRYITSEKPEEWETMMYWDFLKLLNSIPYIKDKSDFMFCFSFIGKVLFVNIENGEWEEVSLNVKSSFSELLQLNNSENIVKDFNFTTFLKDTIKMGREFLKTKK